LRRPILRFAHSNYASSNHPLLIMSGCRFGSPDLVTSLSGIAAVPTFAFDAANSNYFGLAGSFTSCWYSYTQTMIITDSLSQWSYLLLSYTFHCRSWKNLHICCNSNHCHHQWHYSKDNDMCKACTSFDYPYSQWFHYLFWNRMPQRD
jgi:hypothetical protein